METKCKAEMGYIAETANDATDVVWPRQGTGMRLMTEQIVYLYPQYPYIYGYIMTCQPNGDEAGF
jgi:hypothetical protein